MFSLSDTIICINNQALPPDLLACPLVAGREYEVHGLKKCRCGKVYVDIGLSISSQKYDIVCDACQHRFNDGVWWFDAGRFKKKDTASDQLAQLREKEKVANELMTIRLN